MHWAQYAIILEQSQERTLAEDLISRQVADKPASNIMFKETASRVYEEPAQVE